jgi:hypothetical protein
MQSIGVYAKKFGTGTLETLKRLKYAFYILVHPFDGFYDLKNDPRRRTIPGAIVLLVLLAFTTIFKRQLLGYLFTSRYAQLNLDIVFEITVAILPYLLWTLANWCFTSLMDGDGKLSDIFCATAFGTLPLSICNLLQVPVSNFVSLTESGIFLTLASFGVVWSNLMIFVGMLVTHQYSVKKSIATTLLTFVGMGVIAFILVLIFFLIQQVSGFVVSMGTEVMFRVNE